MKNLKKKILLCLLLEKLLILWVFYLVSLFTLKENWYFFKQILFEGISAVLKKHAFLLPIWIYEILYYWGSIQKLRNAILLDFFDFSLPLCKKNSEKPYKIYVFQNILLLLLLRHIIYGCSLNYTQVFIIIISKIIFWFKTISCHIGKRL